MGVRKKSKKLSKAKAAKAKNIRVREALKLRSVDPTKNTFAEIVLERKQTHLDLKTRFEHLCNCVDYGIEYEDLIPLIALLPIQLFLYRDDEYFNILMRFLRSGGDRLNTNLIFEILRRYNKCKGTAMTCLDISVPSKVSRHVHRADALQVALDNKVPLEIIVMLIIYGNHLAPLHAEENHVAKEITFPEVLRQVKDLMNEVDNDTKVLETLRRVSLVDFLNHEDFISLLNIHHMRLRDDSPEQGSEQNRKPKPKIESSISFDQIYRSMQPVLEETLMEGSWKYHYGHVEKVLGLFLRCLERREYDFAEAYLWEAHALTKEHVSPYWHEHFLESWVKFSSMLESVFPKETENMEIMATFKQLLTLQLRIVTEIFKKNEKAETINSDMLNLALLKCYYYEGKYATALVMLNGCLKDFSDPLAIDLSHLFKGMLLYGSNKNDETVADCLLMIEKDETRHTFEFTDFLRKIAKDAAQLTGLFRFEKALEKFELIRSCYPNGYVSLIGEILDPLPISISLLIHSLALPLGCIDVMEFLIEVAEELDVQQTLSSLSLIHRYACDFKEMTINDFDHPSHDIYLHRLLELEELDTIRKILSDPARQSFHKIFRLEFAIVCLQKGSIELGKAILNEVEITREYFNHTVQIGSFEDLVQLCYSSMKEKDYNMALKLAQCGFVFFYNHENIFVCYLIIAKIHRQQRDLDLSIKACRDCLERFPNCSDAYFELGMSLMLSEKKQAAREAFSSCLKINPKHKNAAAALRKTSL
eukprot:TRINITY_DN6681_c1_g4_i1.p1 TRINITY_DN6681_c1_g4~~TRINITY_DN6681_c1_g4_i1.p1  ORF type:complete len:761 (+),score=106.16 TRINITY_DN6681_c1_g4_i1:253-2535(+)